MILSLLAISLAIAAEVETPFEPSPLHFVDTAACRAELDNVAAHAREQGYEAVEGPYEIAAGDVRIHFVRVEGNGHRIDEHRCLGSKLSARSWYHSMGTDEAEFTVESVARDAAWLKKKRAEQ